MVTIRLFAKRAVVSLLVPVFLVTQVAVPRAQIPHDEPSPLKGNFYPPSQNVFISPHHAGKIVEHYRGQSPVKNPTIYHIRDLHAHEAAQRNIASLIESIHHQAGLQSTQPLLVLVEGAAGPVDTDFFGLFPEPDVRRKTLKEFLSAGWINGSEYLSIVKKVTVPIEIVGAEDASLYLKHFGSFRRVMKKRESSRKWIKDIQEQFNHLKRIHFRKDLLRFYDLVESFDEETITFEKFFERLTKFSSSGLSEKEFSQIALFLEVLKDQKEIQEKELEKEKEQLILFLQDRLVKEDLKVVIQKSLEYRLGRLSASDYFKYLLKETQGLGADFPTVAKFVTLLEKQEKINHERLFDEIGQFKRKTIDSLAQTSQERKLIRLLNQFDYFRNLLLLQMSSKDWRAFQDQKFSVDVLKFEEGLGQVSSDLEKIQEILKEAIHFYQLALERDEVLSRNALREIHERKASQAVLITGGFHSEGITKRLRKEGLEFFVILPQVTEDVGEEKYLKLMMDPRIQTDTISFPSQFNHLMDLLNPLLRDKENIKIARTLVRHFIAGLDSGSVSARRDLQVLFLDWKSRLGETDVRKQRLMEILEEEFKVSHESKLAPLSRREIRRLVHKDALTAEITIAFLKQLSSSDDPLITWAQKLHEKRYGKTRESQRIVPQASLVSKHLILLAFISLIGLGSALQACGARSDLEVSEDVKDVADASPIDAGMPTYIESEEPYATGLEGRGRGVSVSNVQFDAEFRLSPSDSGSWAWTYDLSEISDGDAVVRFELIDHDIAQEVAATNNSFVGYIHTDVDTVLRIHFIGSALRSASFDVNLKGGQWNELVISQEDLIAGGLDLTNVDFIYFQAVKRWSADAAVIHLSMIKGPVPIPTGKTVKEAYTVVGQGYIENGQYIGRAGEHYQNLINSAWQLVLARNPAKRNVIQNIQIYSDLDTQAKVFQEHVGIDDDGLKPDPSTGKPKFSRSTLAFILNHETTDHSRGEVIPILGDLRFFANKTLEERVAFIAEVGESDHAKFILENHTKPLEEQFDEVVKYIQENKAGLFTSRHIKQARRMIARKPEVLEEVKRIFTPQIERPRSNIAQWPLFISLIGVLNAVAACRDNIIPLEAPDAGQPSEDLPVRPALPDDQGQPTYIRSSDAFGERDHSVYIVSSDDPDVASNNSISTRSEVVLDSAVKHLATDQGSWAWSYDKGIIEETAYTVFRLEDSDIQAEVAANGNVFDAYLKPDVATVVDVGFRRPDTPWTSQKFRYSLASGVWNRVVVSEEDFLEAGLTLAPIQQVEVSTAGSLSADAAVIHISMVKEIFPEDIPVTEPALPDDGGVPTYIGDSSNLVYSGRSASSVISEISLDVTAKHLETDRGSWAWRYDLSVVQTGWASTVFELADTDISAEIDASGKFSGYLYPNIDTVVDLEVKGRACQFCPPQTVKFRRHLTGGQWNKIEISSTELTSADLNLAWIDKIQVRAIKGMSADQAMIYFSMVDQIQGRDAPIRIPISADDLGSPTYLNTRNPIRDANSVRTFPSFSFDETVKHVPTDSGSWQVGYSLYGEQIDGAYWSLVEFYLVDQDISTALAAAGNVFIVYLNPDAKMALDIGMLDAGQTQPVWFRVSLDANVWNKVTIPTSVLTAAGLDLANIEGIKIRLLKWVSPNGGTVHLSMVKPEGPAPRHIMSLPDDMTVPTYINSETPHMIDSGDPVGTVSLDTSFKHLSADSGSWKWTYDFNTDHPFAWADTRFSLIDQDITQEIGLTGGAFVGYMWPNVDTILDLQISDVGLLGIYDPAWFRVSLTGGQWNKVVIPEAQLTAEGHNLINVNSVVVKAVKGVSVDQAEIHMSMVKGPFKVPGSGPVKAQAPPSEEKIKAIQERLKPTDFENLLFEVVDDLGPGYENDFAHLADGRVLVRRDLWGKIKGDPKAQFILRRHEYVENVLIPRLVTEGRLERSDLDRAHALTSAVDALEEGTPVHALMKHVIPLMSNEALQAIQSIHLNDPNQEFYHAAQSELGRRYESQGRLRGRLLKVWNDIDYSLNSFRENFSRLVASAPMKALTALLLITTMGFSTRVYADGPKKNEDEKKEEKVSAEGSGVIGSDGNFSYTEFRVGYETEKITLNLDVGTNMILTQLIDEGDFQLYHESVPLLGLITRYTGDAQSALVHLKMPQYIYYADIDLSLGDVDLVFGGQMFMLPNRVGNEYRLRPLEAAPYGGVRWRRITDWDTSIGKNTDFSGNLDGKLFYQRTPADRLYNSKVFDQSGLVLDTSFEYEISKEFRLRLPSEFHANLQPWLEYLFQMAKWYDYDKDNPNYDTVYQEIERQATRGFIYYAKLNFDNPLSVLGDREGSKLRVWGPMLFGLKLGPELLIQKGPFQIRTGGGMEVISVPQMTASAGTYKEDYKDHKKALFFPWAVEINPYGYISSEFERDKNRATIDLEIHGTKFNDGEFALGLPNPFAVKLAYEREDLFGTSMDLGTFVQYRNFTDPFGYVIIPDSRVEFGLSLHYGKAHPRKRIAVLSREERLDRKINQLEEEENQIQRDREELQKREKRLKQERENLEKKKSDLQNTEEKDDPKKGIEKSKSDKERIKPLIEKLEEVDERLEQYEKDFKEQRNFLKVPKDNSKRVNQSFFIALLGLVGWGTQGDSRKEKSVFRKFTSVKLIPLLNKVRNHFSKSLQSFLFFVLVSLLPGCGLFTSHPYERYEDVTVAEQENYVEEGPPTLWEFVTMGGIHEQSLHSDLIRGSNNAIRFRSGEIVKLYFNSGYQETEEAKSFVTRDSFNYYSNGISHDLVVLDIDGRSYRLSVDVSGGDEKEYKISVSGLVKAILYNGLNLDKLKEIQIIPTGEGQLEINGFIRNPILRLDEGAAPVIQLENFPPQVYDISTFTNLGDGMLDVGDPRMGEDTVRVSWPQTPEDAEGFLLSAGDPSFNFGDSVSVNVYGTSSILYVTFERTSGLSRTIVLGNVQPNGSHMNLTSDLVEKLAVDPQSTEPFDLSTIASVEFKVNETEPGAGDFSVQGIFDDYAGQITPLPFTNAPDQQVTLLSQGAWSFYSPPERMRVSTDVNFVIDNKQGASDMMLYGDHLGFSILETFPRLGENAYQYVISGVDHDLTFVLRDQNGGEVKSIWNIQTDVDDLDTPVFVKVDFEDIRRDLEGEGAVLSDPIQITKIDFKPKESLGNEYLKLNTIVPLWVSVPNPLEEGQEVDYFTAAARGHLNLEKMEQVYFAGQNPEDLQSNYFRYRDLSNLAGMWFEVDDDFSINREFRMKLSSEAFIDFTDTKTDPSTVTPISIPSIPVLEIKDDQGRKVKCYILNPMPDQYQYYSTKWDTSFVSLVNPDLALSNIDTVVLYVDRLDLGNYHSLSGPYHSAPHGNISFQGLLSADAGSSMGIPRIPVTPQPVSDGDILDYFAITNYDSVNAHNLSSYYFFGMNPADPESSGIGFSDIYPSWIAVNDDLGGIYFILAHSDRDFSTRNTLTIQAKSPNVSSFVLELKDINGRVVRYELSDLTSEYQTYVLDLTLIAAINPDFDRSSVAEVLFFADADLLWQPGSNGPYLGSGSIKGILHMEAMEIPRNSEGWAEKLVVKNQKGDSLNEFGRVKEVVQARSKHVKWNFKDREINIHVDQDLLSKLGMAEKEFLKLLDSSVRLDEKINRINYRGLPSRLTFALLEKSSHLFENHDGDGFIGIHRSLFDQGSADVLSFGVYRSSFHHNSVEVLSLFKAGIIHELRHEAYPDQEIEKRQVEWDAQFLFEIAHEQALNFVSELSNRDLVRTNDMTQKMTEHLVSLVASAWEREGQVLILREISEGKSDPRGWIESLSNWLSKKLEKFPKLKSHRQIIIKNILSVIGNDENFSRSHEGLPRIYQWIIRELLTQRGIQNELIEEVINLFEDATFDIDLETGEIQADPVLMRTLDEILLLSGLDKKGMNVQKMVAMIKATSYVRNILEETLSDKEKIDQNEKLRQIEDGKFLQNAREILGTKDVIEILTQFVIAKATGLDMAFFGEASFVLENFLGTRSYELISFHVEDEGRLLMQIKEQDPDLIERHGWDLKRILVAYRKNQRDKLFGKTVNILKSLLRGASKQEKFTLGMFLSRYDDSDIQWLKRLKKQISELTHERASLNERSLFSISRFGPLRVQPEPSIFGESA